MHTRHTYTYDAAVAIVEVPLCAFIPYTLCSQTKVVKENPFMSVNQLVSRSLLLASNLKNSKTFFFFFFCLFVPLPPQKYPHLG